MYLDLVLFNVKNKIYTNSHYGASRLCEAASRHDVRGSLRSLGWMSDKLGSLHSLRCEVPLQMFISKLATTHGTAKEAAKSGDAVKTIEDAEGIEAVRNNMALLIFPNNLHIAVPVRLARPIL